MTLDPATVDLAPLHALRLRTPRLELRLPTAPELADLQQRARLPSAIHPPEEMPFEVPWTDDTSADDWLTGFHEQLRADWRPEAWILELGVWAEGALAGFQGMRGRNFSVDRRVVTGSWLLRDYQRHGYGTEMRAAVLELAFRGLGADVAVSGAIAGNHASARVSEKLGYRLVGHSEVAPRGMPVRHADLELRRDEWRPPVPVELEGVESTLPLFGAAVSSR